MYRKGDEKMKAPQMISEKGQKALFELIALAAANGMIDQADANNAKKILATNPEMRLSRAFTRLKNVEDLVYSMRSVDSRATEMIKTFKAELEEIRYVGSLAHRTEDS